MKNKKYLICGIPVIFAAALFVLSCRSVNNRRNYDFRTTSAVRLEDIYAQINEDPVSAISLIYMYKEIYSAVNNDENDWLTLAVYEEESIKNLVKLQEKAVEEENWEYALSLGRSIANLGIINSYTGKEGDFLLAAAKKSLLDENHLSAFLYAVQAHQTSPLDFDSACLFLEKAVEARQRRTAAFFLAAALYSGGADFPGEIPHELIEYASGHDSISDMINGVATVIVDRGIRIERGVGYADRVGGSAFFIDSSGLLITNYHVIESEVDPKYSGYSRMYIRMGDATSPRIPARVVGYDKALDLALIKAEIETDYVFSIVDSVIPNVGDMVLAIGSPLGLEKTVTSGIVSSLSRRLLQIGDVIQIDAAVNSGNSGGPVIDFEGRLVGVAFAGVGQAQGLNFIIPAERLAAALPEMLKGGKAQRPWLGLTISETFSRAEIIYASPFSPAAMHQVTEGSYIWTVNGKTITAQQGGLIPALQNEIFSTSVGELVAVETIDQGGEIKRHVFMTAARPDLPLLEAAKIDSRERIAAPLFGMILVPLQSGIFASNFRVDKVIRGSIADEAGISADDPITINRLRLFEEEGYALLEISIRKRRVGYLETSMALPVWLDSPDTL